MTADENDWNNIFSFKIYSLDKVNNPLYVIFTDKSFAFASKNEVEAIDKIILQFMAKNLQLQYSGRGRKVKGVGKKGFSKTNLCTLLLGNNFLHKNWFIQRKI